MHDTIVYDTSPLYKAGHSGGIIADDIMHSKNSKYADVAKN